MAATECMHERFYFSDVQIRGHNPAFAKREWECKGYHIRMEPENGHILTEANAVKDPAASMNDGSPKHSEIFIIDADRTPDFPRPCRCQSIKRDWGENRR